MASTISPFLGVEPKRVELQGGGETIYLRLK